MIQQRRFIFQSILISILGIVLMMNLHFNKHVDTMLNCWDKINRTGILKIDQEYLQDAVQYHKNNPAFSRRPFSTFIIEQTAAFFHIQIGTAFVLCNFIMFFLCGLLIHYLTFLFCASYQAANAAQILFFLSFSILCAFFYTNYTYDEPVNYLLILLCLIAYLKHNHFLFFIFFLLACISREATYLFVPSILWYTWMDSPKYKKVYKTLILFIGFSLIVMVHYVLLQIYFPQGFDIAKSTELGKRLTSFHFNFQNNGYAVESILSGFLILFFPLFLLFKYLHCILINKKERILLMAFMVILILNSLMIYFAAYARESRLFALPLLLAYPLLGKYFMMEFNTWTRLHTRKIEPINMVFCLLNLIILYEAYDYVFNGYVTTIQSLTYNYNAEYLFLVTILIVIINIKDMMFTTSLTGCNMTQK